MSAAVRFHFDTDAATTVLQLITVMVTVMITITLKRTMTVMHSSSLAQPTVRSYMQTRKQMRNERITY